MNMISYWKNHKEIYNDEGLVLIIGHYDHKNQNNGGSKALGVHWGSYPQSRGILSPCVIPENTRNSMLAGLLNQATVAGDITTIEKLIEAIKFFKK